MSCFTPSPHRSLVRNVSTHKTRGTSWLSFHFSPTSPGVLIDCCLSSVSEEFRPDVPIAGIALRRGGRPWIRTTLASKVLRSVNLGGVFNKGGRIHI